MKNNKGFTLVELLAVIVVLALLMVVATRTIGTSMSSGKKNILRVESQKMLNAAFIDIKSSFELSNSVISVSGEKVYIGDDYSIIKYNESNSCTGYFKVDSYGVITSYCIRDEQNKLSLSDSVLNIEVLNTLDSQTPEVRNNSKVLYGTENMCDVNEEEIDIINID